MDPNNAPKKRRRWPVDAALFVRTWQQSNSIAEAATRLNMPCDVVRARAIRYRQKGVNLKKMPRSQNKNVFDVDMLNRIAKESLPPGSTDLIK